jgi:beta-N-acetylhexosaminidase
MQSLGEQYQTNPNAAWQACVAVGIVMAAELQACQIDLSFAPVLDLDYGSSAVIGNRSFGRDPNVVAYLASGIMYGMSLAGMSHCGKHFPGHGFVQADSHTEIPVDDRSYDEIDRDDIQPYRALMSGLASVMPAHVIYPKVDSQPAGFSKVWLQDILRGKLNFVGSIFSDDLSMEGASIAGDYAARAKIALDAGCDYLLICNQPQATQLLFDQVQADWVQSQVRRALHINQSHLSWYELSQWSLYTQAKIRISQF